MRGVFRHGGCYELYRILRAMDPQARPWYRNGHVYTEIAGALYDIDGEWTPTTEERAGLRPLFSDGRKPWTWRNREGGRRRGFRERHIEVIRIDWSLRLRLQLSRLKIAALALVLSLRRRREVFRAIRQRAEANAVRVYETEAEYRYATGLQRPCSDTGSTRAAGPRARSASGGKKGRSAGVRRRREARSA